MAYVKYFETITNARGDSLPDYRVQVVDSLGAVVDIYRDKSGTRFTDGTGATINFTTAGPSGKAEFYWGPATGQVLQVLDGSGDLVDTTADFADGYVIDNLPGNISQAAVTDLTADLAAKADAAPTTAALATKANTADLASTDSDKGAGLTGFSHAADYAAGTAGDRLKREVFITDAPFNAVGDAVAGRTGVATAGDATFTDANASWTSADIGKTIIIGEGGASNVRHKTTIASINSGTSIELTLAPVSSLASCRYAYGTPADTAINSALAYVFALGGGIVRVPGRNYLLADNILKIGANTSFLCDDGARFFKGHDATFMTNGLGYNTSSVIAAYQGHGNIVIAGGSWEGFACGVFDGYTGFALGYGTNIIVRDLIMLDAINDGHSVDMAACDNVIFDNCQFYGYALNGGTPSLCDTIQLDACVEGSFPYFGVPVFKQCRNITVRRSAFGPNPDNTDIRFGNIQVGIGSHASVQGQFAENITIDDIRIDAPEYAGVRIWKWKNVKITKSVFTNGTGRGIHVTATPSGSLSSQDINRVQTNQAEASDGIYLDKCEFTGFTGSGGLPLFISNITYGTDVTIKHENIEVVNCKFKSISTYCMDVRDVRRMSVGPNQTSTVGRLFTTADVAANSGSNESIVIHPGNGNSFSDTVGAIVLFNTIGFSITGGVLRNMQGRTVLTELSSNGKIADVTQIDFCLATTTAGIAVQNSCNNVSVTAPVSVRITSTGVMPDVTISGSCNNVDCIDPVSNTTNVPVFHQATGGIAKLRGTGTPEGVITARIGSQFMRTDGGATTTLYIKTSGTGNTGWTAK